MKAKYIKKEPTVFETWSNSDEKGYEVTATYGDVFKIEPWGTISIGICDSVVTKNGEWMCDVDCREFAEMFEKID